MCSKSLPCALALTFEQSRFAGCTSAAGARAAPASPEFRMLIEFLQGSVFRLHCSA